ncbi:2-phosphosulfolactate phosphatase [Streptomyces marispadix]|uniref:Probable 2-phosphosulfolactate phosphatase n=1 Tax=Streptomyces marispadix TaxID=2922868 RepID=A0ABS9T640_9ACTN|nr:2-phosphosulfolactate phosphatase [Streptomyces marispadix]MCH6164011.1 2-phosphosulfolactate phosphatase [Streptomyces marispadix]
MAERGCFTQHGYGVRFEWGPQGARQLAPETACLVVVDVLSFTTSVTVAVERGIRIVPCRWGDERAAALAAEFAARLAVGRREVTAEAPWSLSPAALRRAPFVPRLVLPSPNGATVAVAAAESGAVVAAASLRNAHAVGEWLAAKRYGTSERPVGVVAAGERRADGSLRPAAEDLLGAGAVIAALAATADRTLSPEAALAAAAYTGTADIAQAVNCCASGRELTEDGFAEDVAVATEPVPEPDSASGAVPVLTEGAFTAAD